MNKETEPLENVLPHMEEILEYILDEVCNNLPYLPQPID